MLVEQFPQAPFAEVERIFDAAIEITIPDLQFAYRVGVLKEREEVIQPETITVDPPPFAFKAGRIFDVSRIRGRLIVVGGDQFENSGDRLVVHNQQGLSAAGQLEVSVNTVRNYIRSIYDKLQVHTMSEAVRPREATRTGSSQRRMA